MKIRFCVWVCVLLFFFVALEGLLRGEGGQRWRGQVRLTSFRLIPRLTGTAGVKD